MKRAIPSSWKSGLTLMELLVAMGVLAILWGSVAGFVIGAKRTFKDVIHGTRSTLVLAALGRVERDLYSSILSLKGNAHEVILEGVGGTMIYSFREGKLVCGRTADTEPSVLSPQPSALSPQPSALSPQSSIVLEDVDHLQWKFFRGGKWREDWNGETLPEALFLKITSKEGSFQMIYRLRAEG